MHEYDDDYRHEFKYIISASSLLSQASFLGALMDRDAHAGEKGYYSIRSLYFDDMEDSLAGDNISGTDEREKWRIRIYDRDPGYISLERKSRKSDLISKSSCCIDRDTYGRIMDGTLSPGGDQPALLNRFLIGMRTRLLHPVVIVEYERIPFTANEGNTRVTIDKDIRSSTEFASFLKDTPLVSRPVLSQNMGLIEVKFDEYLPDHIAHAVERGNMRRETFSKYLLARRFTPDGLFTRPLTFTGQP